MIILKNGLKEGYAIVVWAGSKGKVLKEVQGKAIAKDFAIVYNDLTKRYSIIVIGTGLNVSNDTYTLKELNSFLKSTDLNKYLDNVKKNESYNSVVETSKKMFDRLMKENKWYYGEC